MTRIPVYAPSLTGRERDYVEQCLASTWISSKGAFIERFEAAFGAFIGARHCSSVCNGTVALHLALTCLGIGPGDEVIVPTLTYIASVNTIVQVGASPVFVDSLDASWQLDPADVARKLTPRTRAVMAVHLYGQACDMAALTRLCREHHLLLIEDCAEAIGTYYQGQHVGTFGDIATFSFYGNKTITTGEGGMVVSPTPEMHARTLHLKNQAMSPERTYWHDAIGFNYRMTNICAAIGLAQLEQVQDFLRRKRALAMAYRQALEGLPATFHAEVPGTTHSFWMCSLAVDDAQHRDALRSHLQERQIETRPVFYPAHVMPVYRQTACYPVAEKIAACGINLPSWPGLTDDMVAAVCQAIRDYFEHSRVGRC